MNIACNYHERTKHYYNRYAKSLGYLDWAHKPHPYRSYEDAPRLFLPLDGEFSLRYNELFANKEPNVMDVRSIGSFFRYALGLAAVKKFGSESWELRVNASSGNLHPTEAYCIVPGSIVSKEDATLFHYHSYLHALEELYVYEALSLPSESFVVVLSSIIYKEMWKYGERCYRYCALDFGHAYRALEVAANLHGWHLQALDLSEQECGHLVGLDQKERFEQAELEGADIAVLVSRHMPKNVKSDILRNVKVETFQAFANRLCSYYQKYEIVEQMDASTKASVVSVTQMQQSQKSSEAKATDVILRRRSAQAFDMENSKMALDELMELLNGVQMENPQIDFILYIHNVSGLLPGVYLYKRSSMTLRLKEEFLYDEVASGLFVLALGDVRVLAKNFSCMQDIAADSAFALSMIAGCEDALSEPVRYKERLFEAGRIGQQLYLDATSLGYSATGIGCFYDDAIHNFLGLELPSRQVVYNFTVGKALRDARLQTLPPYGHLKR